MEQYRIGQKICLTIESLGSNGEGVGHSDGYTVFVEKALPGEQVETQLYQCSRRFARGKLVRLIKKSEARTTPPCELFGKCGGCQLMHLSYASQLEMKQKRVYDAMKRVAGLADPEVYLCEPSTHELAYRNKILLPARSDCRGDLTLGLYAARSHTLVPISSCMIHCSHGDQVYGVLRKILQRSNIAPYDPKSGRGELRYIFLKSAIKNREVLVTFVTAKKSKRNLMAIAEELMASCSTVKGVVHNLNNSRDNKILGDTFSTLLGEGHLCDEIGGLTFKVSPASFFQVNPEQAEKLYRKVESLAALTGTEVVLDGYCGVGTLSLLMAGGAKQVVGVEAIACAIEDAEENARLNKITNAEFICGDSAKVIPQLLGIDIVLLNPPRKGCESAVLGAVVKLSPQKIIYISCDPATLARDLAILLKSSYTLSGLYPFDMFPQTAHVETVALLERTKSL